MNFSARLKNKGAFLFHRKKAAPPPTRSSVAASWAARRRHTFTFNSKSGLFIQALNKENYPINKDLKIRKSKIIKAAV